MKDVMPGGSYKVQARGEGFGACASRMMTERDDSGQGLPDMIQEELLRYMPHRAVTPLMQATCPCT